MKKFILLLRHGAVDHSFKRPDCDLPLADGGKDVAQVAAKLADHLAALRKEERIHIGELWHGSYRHVRESAGVVYDALDRAGLVDDRLTIYCSPALDPEMFRAADDPAARHKVGRWLVDRVKALPRTRCPVCQKIKPANAMLVVGHAPHLGWTAEQILGRPHPIDRADLVCIALDDSPSWLDRLLGRARWVPWVISPSDEGSMAELREKIQSKMNLAGVLGGVVAALFGVLLGLQLTSGEPAAFLGRLDTPATVALYGAAVCFFIALGLYFAAMYAYDRLLMPARFWSEKAKVAPRKWLVQRPPSSSLWVLYQNMVRTWKWVFSPATFFAIAGLLLLAIAVIPADIAPTTRWLLVLGLVLLPLAVYGYAYYLRPVLGTED